ncbi:MAG: mechanosensitive ion channel family protein [Propionibacteriaceae bacterium]|jgi:small conductance mechanosensitive channel|nr:mechanosensitive ion channel family protein [Propionibacteriaceae bacterium]
MNCTDTWCINGRPWENVALYVAIILVGAIITGFIAGRLIDRTVKTSVRRVQQRAEGHTMRGATASDTSRTTHRMRTLGHALKLLVNWAIVIIAVVMALHELGVSTAPLLASAGIGGIAIGLGAQSLIKDLLGGVFLILEDQFGVGDFVIVGDLKGTVQNIGTRVTRIQDTSGAIWYVRNGEISTLGNQSQGWSTTYVKLPVAATEDPFQVIRVLESVADELERDPAWHDQMLEPPDVQGLSAFDSNEMVFQVRLKCPANKQGGVERELRARALLAFQRCGINASSLIGVPGVETAELPEPENPPDGESGWVSSSG